ncbi:hypothetical protein EI555_014965, partial [Monodon monoceros]
WFTCKLFPEVSRRARLTRVIGQWGQTRAVIGRGSGLAGAGRGRKLTGTMAATVPLRDRLSFLHRLPILLKGTSDDDVPCPGYLFEEIASILPCGHMWGPWSRHLPEISHESLGSSRCLLEYLLSRLQSGSGRVKLKVLKILLHLCGHGSSSFLLILKRNPAFIQEAAVFTGPPDPLHGNSLYQKVRAAAQGPASSRYASTSSPITRFHSAGAHGLSSPEYPGLRVGVPAAADVGLPTGMGSQSRPQSSLQGFGYSKERGHTAMRHQPGQAGGGWDELDSSPNSQDSSQENDDLGKASDSGSPSGSDSPSGASRAPSDLAERVEAVTLSDCQQELSLVRAVTRGPHCFLSREEVQHFVKECGLLNCEAVLELLIRHLGASSERVQMRALGAIASLGCTDLLSQERVLLLARPRLQELSVGSPGPVTNKATKILRHFEASCRQWPPARRPPAEPGPAVARVGPSDLLTDTLPFTGGQAFLQPLSSALFSPKSTAPPSGLQPGPVPPTSLDGCPLPARADAREAKTRLAGSREQGAGSERGSFSTNTAKRGPELDSGPGDSCGSLFAGMELVACPRLVGAGTAAEEPLPACQAPWTSSQRVASKEPSGSEPSAFAFLNS